MRSKTILVRLANDSVSPRLGGDVRGGEEGRRHQKLLRRAGDAAHDRERRGPQGDESVAVTCFSAARTVARIFSIGRLQVLVAARRPIAR